MLTQLDSTTGIWLMVLLPFGSASPYCRNKDIAWIWIWEMEERLLLFEELITKMVLSSHTLIFLKVWLGDLM